MTHWCWSRSMMRSRTFGGNAPDFALTRRPCPHPSPPVPLPSSHAPAPTRRPAAPPGTSSALRDRTGSRRAPRTVHRPIRHPRLAFPTTSHAIRRASPPHPSTCGTATPAANNRSSDSRCRSHRIVTCLQHDRAPAQCATAPHSDTDQSQLSSKSRPSMSSTTAPLQRLPPHRRPNSAARAMHHRQITRCRLPLQPMRLAVEPHTAAAGRRTHPDGLLAAVRLRQPPLPPTPPAPLAARRPIEIRVELDDL